MPMDRSGKNSAICSLTERSFRVSLPMPARSRGWRVGRTAPGGGSPCRRSRQGHRCQERRPVRRPLRQLSGQGTERPRAPHPVLCRTAHRPAGDRQPDPPRPAAADRDRCRRFHCAAGARSHRRRRCGGRGESITAQREYQESFRLYGFSFNTTLATPRFGDLERRVRRGQQVDYRNDFEGNPYQTGNFIERRQACTLGPKATWLNGLEGELQYPTSTALGRTMPAATATTSAPASSARSEVFPAASQDDPGAAGRTAIIAHRVTIRGGDRRCRQP